MRAPINLADAPGSREAWDRGFLWVLAWALVEPLLVRSSLQLSSGLRVAVLRAFGAEIGTAYSELTDPVDQRQRFTQQSIAAAGGDVEAMQLDEAFLAALEYAMPPTGGLGLGVDRLVMMLTGASIKATLAFPFVRPQG